MAIDFIYDVFLKSGRVTTDSRNCPADAIYFALKGERFDGNNYATAALDAGCSLAVVDSPEMKNHPKCYWVPDALSALQQLAAHHRKATEVKVVGITGSNGKTTTKELMAAVLSRKFKVWFTQGNLNNHIGVPLTLLAMPPDTQIAVVEMGANHQGEIALLCEIAQPDMGLITNVGKAHLEGFGSFEGVKIAKGELYGYLKRNGKEVFINGDNSHLKEMLGNNYSPVYRYGANSDFEICARNPEAEPFLKFDWKVAGSKIWNNVATKLTGLYNLENALAAISVGSHFGVDIDSVNKAIGEYAPVNYRSQIVKTDSNTIVLDAYNANPSSMSAALDNFRVISAQSKILILGGMKELGTDCEKEHRSLLLQLAEISFDKCILVGEEFKGLLPADHRYYWFDNRDPMMDFLREHPIHGAYILVKGSRANQLEKVVEVL